MPKETKLEEVKVEVKTDVVSENKTNEKQVSAKVEEDFGAGDPEPEKKALYRVWLPEDHKGSRKIRLATGQQFNLNRLDESDQVEAKKQSDYPEHIMKLFPSEVESLRTGYGFSIQKAPKVTEVKAEV